MTNFTGKAGSLSSAQISEKFDASRSAGNWLLWLAVLLSAVWFGVIGYAAYSLQQAGQLANIETYLKVCAAVAAALPGLLILMAGFMARSSRRSAEANALVLEATQRLLLPAQEAGEEGLRFAEQMKLSAQQVDTAMASALTAMKTVAAQIGDERMRLESVSYASADNARDLTERMAQERGVLENVARQLRGQLDEMNQAIPNHSAIMVQTAKDVTAELDSAQAKLQSRIDGMRTAGQSLSQRLVEMDGLAQSAAQRTDTLTHAVAQIHQKLDQSRKTVDTAVRASEIAVAAATTTGDKLQDAVSSALEGARQANEEITRNTHRAAENTARTLAELRVASDQATRSLQQAGTTARSELSDITMNGVGDPVTDRFSVDRLAAENAAHNSVDDFSLPAEPPVVRHPPPLVEQTAHVAVDDGMFESGQGDRIAVDNSLTFDQSTPPSIFDEPTQTSAPLAIPEIQSIEAPVTAALSAMTPEDELFERSADALVNSAHGSSQQTQSPSITANNVNGNSANGSGEGVGWRDILTDMDKEDHPQLSREDVADELLDRLQDSGVHLQEIFKPKFKRKIATAAQRGVPERRNSIKGLVGYQVDRVQKRIQADRELMNLARQFHAYEEADALNALQQTARTKRNASPRLAAYLLVDATAPAN